MYKMLSMASRMSAVHGRPVVYDGGRMERSKPLQIRQIACIALLIPFIFNLSYFGPSHCDFFLIFHDPIESQFTEIIQLVLEQTLREPFYHFRRNDLGHSIFGFACFQV